MHVLQIWRVVLLHLLSDLVVAQHAHRALAVHKHYEISSVSPYSDSRAGDATPVLTIKNDLKQRADPTPSPSTTPFQPLAANNIAVYIGHSPGNFAASLPALCADVNINIVILAFIRSFNGANLLPTFDIAPSCDSRKVTNYSAPFACASYASQVAQCQAAGKKVFISVGGSVSNTTFGSRQQAVDAATTIWNVFGAGTATPSLRPFASVVLDGVDVDQEGTSPTTYYDVFAQTLRSLYASSTTDTAYYLSAAPLCSNTSAVLPTGFYQNAHFVFVRFYNAKVCNVGTKGYIPSMIAWRNYFASISGPSGVFPRLYIGALSFDNANSGFVDGPTFQPYVRQGAGSTTDRFGGVMLWDGTNGEVPDAAGRTYVNYTKEALNTPSIASRVARPFPGTLWAMVRNALGGA